MRRLRLRNAIVLLERRNASATGAKMCVFTLYEDEAAGPILGLEANGATVVRLKHELELSVFLTRAGDELGKPRCAFAVYRDSSAGLTEIGDG